MEEFLLDLVAPYIFADVKSKRPTILTEMETCLTNFIELNFFVYKKGEPQLAVEKQNQICFDLACEGEQPLKQAKNLQDFWYLHLFFRGLKIDPFAASSDDDNQIIFMLKLRYLFLYQTFLLKAPSARLRTMFLELMKWSDTVKVLLRNPENATDQSEFYSISACLYTTFYDYAKAEQQMNAFRDLLHMKVDFSGALGKRTRFQQDSKSQLLLSIQLGELATPAKQKESLDLPKNFPLNDEAVMEEIKFEEEFVGDLPNLTEEQQCYLLALCFHYRLTRPRDEILTEELGTILAAVLKKATCWTVATEALFRRSVLERSSTRRLERTLYQLEDLSNQCSQAETVDASRKAFFFLTRMPSKFHIEMELASVLASTGCVKSALDYYLKWEQWNEIIECYITLGRREDAEVLIRNQLEKFGPNTELLCALGDVTKDRSHYQTAWEVSGQRSARAMRNLGMIHMMIDKDHTQASVCFEKSLELNPLQVGLWFTYGCCCLQLAEYVKAENAFKRCLQIESDNFEAWNNCALALIKRGEKSNAFTLLKESIKCNYENWRLWENYMTVAVDIGEFQEAIRAYNRLLEMNRKISDAPVLSALVKAVNDNLPDKDGHSAGALRAKVVELFAGVTNLCPDNADVWKLNAVLLKGMPQSQSDTKQRIMQYLQKSHRCLTQSPNWENDVEKCVQIMTSTNELAAEYISLLQDTLMHEDTDSQATLRNQILASCRLMLRNVLARVKKVHWNSLKEDYPECLQLCVRDTQTHLDSLNNAN